VIDGGMDDTAPVLSSRICFMPLERPLMALSGHGRARL